MWNAIPLFWKACLEESWAAYCVGTMPIGAGDHGRAWNDLIARA